MYLKTDRKIGPLNLKGILFTLGKVVVACIPVTVFCVGAKARMGELWQEGSSLRGLGFLLLTGLGAGGLLWGMYMLLGIDIFRFGKGKGERAP